MMEEQLSHIDNGDMAADPMAVFDKLGELIMKTGLTSEQLVEEHLKEKYAL